MIGRRKKLAYIVFLFCGVLTAFFDFLTYPISTFGVPMLFYLFLSDAETAEEKLSAIIKNGLSWCIGFAGMWVSKWIIGSIITGENIFSNGLEAVINRTSTLAPDGITEYSVLDCEIKNYTAFFKTPGTIIAIIFLLYLVLRCIKQKDVSLRDSLRTLIPYLLTGSAPLLWYAFATNHSMIHYWFTNKACVISILAILFGTASILKTKLSK